MSGPFRVDGDEDLLHNTFIMQSRRMPGMWKPFCWNRRMVRNKISADDTRVAQHSQGGVPRLFDEGVRESPEGEA
jgi:hypothetical protein